MEQEERKKGRAYGQNVWQDGIHQQVVESLVIGVFPIITHCNALKSPWATFSAELRNAL